MKVTVPVLVVLIGLAPALEARGNTRDPMIFQESYDQEAKGRDREALDVLDQLSPQKNASYVAFLRKGWLHHRLGQNVPAIAAYEKAIALAPKSIEPRLGILLPLLAERRWSAAERQAREILKIDPENYLASLRLAFALYNQGKFPESRARYQKVVERYPSDMDARCGLGFAYLKLGKAREARAIFQIVLEFSPRNTLARQGMTMLGHR